jgi:hypothetical protein
MSLRYLKDSAAEGKNEVSPIATFVDPVSKIRVSQPENLIDTDFEYGLQETKWETLERVNNIPTFFARPGDPPIDVSIVTATVGSSTLVVTTNTDHGLVVGSPLIVQGVDSFSANGAFVVDNVINDKEFTYVCKEVQTRPGASEGSFFNIIKEETVMYIGRLYQGTQAKLDVLDSITTDGLDPSRLTVKTPHPHGFSEGTRFVLSNSVGGKTYKFDASLIDPSDFENLTTPEIDSYTQIKEAYTYQDWDGAYSAKFTSDDVDVYYNTINVPNHPFNNGDMVMYIPAVDVETDSQTADEGNIHTDSAMGNVGRYRTPYWVGVLDENTIQLTVSEFDVNYRPPSVHDISSMGDTNFGYHQLAKCYRIEALYTDSVMQLRQPYRDTNSSEAQEVYVFSTSTGIQPAATTMSFKNYTSNDAYTPTWYKFYLKNYDGSNVTNLPTSAGNAILRFGALGVNVSTDRITITPGSDFDLLGSMPLNGNTEGVSNSSLSSGYWQTGDQVRLWRRKGETTPGNIGEGTYYYIRVINDSTFTLHTTRAGAIANNSRLDITSTGSIDLEIIVEKQNRFFKLYTDAALTQEHVLSGTVITGTTWIVPATTVENRSSINDLTVGQNAFSNLNSGDVLTVESFDNSLETDVPVPQTRVDLTTYEDVYLYPAINLNVDSPLIYPRSGKTLYYIPNGTKMKHQTRPASMIVNCQSINVLNSQWSTTSGVDEHYFTYGFKNGDKVTWKQIPSIISFNARDVNINNGQISLWNGYVDTRNGDRVRVQKAGAITVLPAGLDEETDYFLRRITINVLTLHTTEADANSGANPVTITSRGMGNCTLIHQENLPDVLRNIEDQEAYFRFDSTSVFRLYDTRENAIIGGATGLIALTPRGGWAEFRSVLDETTGLFYAPNHYYEFAQSSATVDTATDIITTPTPHGFHTGEQLYYVVQENTPITGLSNQDWYFPNVIDETSFTLHSSRADARNGVSKRDLSGTPIGNATLTRFYGLDIQGDLTQINTTDETITFEFNHGFETGDNVSFWSLSGSISGLSSRLQYFVNKISDTTVAFYFCRAHAIADTNRVNLTGASGWHAVKKVEKLPEDVNFYFRDISSDDIFRIYRTRDEAIRNVMELDMRRPPDNSHTVTNLSIQWVGSAISTFIPVNAWCQIGSVNNYGANYFNTDYNNQFKTGQQVRVVRLPQFGNENPQFKHGSLHYIRHISNTVLAFHRTYEGAMNNVTSDRVDIYSGEVGWFIEGVGLPSGIGVGTSLVIEKPTPTSIRFRENGSSGRIRRIRPTRDALYSSIRFSRRAATQSSNTFFVNSHGLIENTPLIYNSGPFGAPNSEPQITNNSTYYVSSPTNDRFRISTNEDSETKTITLTGNAVDLVGSFFRSDETGLTRTCPNQASGSFVNLTTDVITTSIVHGFSTGDRVTYYALPESTTNFGTPISGLTSENDYYVRITGTTSFQLHNTADDALNDINRIDFTGYGSGEGLFSRDNFVTGESVLISSTSPISGLSSGSVYYIKTLSPQTFALYYTKSEAEAGIFNQTGDSYSDLRAPILSFIEGTSLSLRRKEFVNLLTTATGIQELSNVAQNAVDGIYDLDVKVGGPGSTEFTLTPTNAVLSPRSITFNPYDDFSSGFNAIRYENHKLYNGAEIIYNQSSEISLEQNTDGVNESTGVFTIPSHGLITEQELVYIVESPSQEIPGLQNNASYYVNVISSDTFSLHTSSSDAASDTDRVKVWGIESNIIETLESTFINDTLDLITTTADHNLSTGQAVVFNSVDPPTGVTSGDTYYVRVFDADQFYLHETYEDSLVEANAIDLLTAGSGTHYIDVIDEEVIIGYGETEDYGTATLSAFSTLERISGLDNNNVYYVIRISKDWFTVASTRQNANLGNSINIGAQLADEGSLGSDENHSFLTYNVGAEVLGPGTVTTTLGSSILSGINTNFFNLFKNGDLFKIFITQDEDVLTLSQTNSAVNREISFTQNVSTVNTTTNIITTPTHNYFTGDYVVYTADTPAGNITSGQGYHVRINQTTPVNATTFTLHETKQDAFDNINIVNITSSGSGTAIFTQQDQFYSPTHTYTDGQTASYTSSEIMSTLIDGRLYYIGRNSNIRELFSTNIATNDIVTTNAVHGLTTGDAVRFESAVSPEPLVSGREYFIRTTSTSAFYLYNNRADSLSDSNRVDILTTGSGTHKFVQTEKSNTFRFYPSYDEAIAAAGTQDGVQVELVSTAGNAVVTSKYAGAVFESKVLGVRSATGIVLEDEIPEFASDDITPIGTQSGFQYALVTSLFVKADGFALHRPFDGGVELTPSLNPDSSIIRQTRRYFRYQSGKGIQVSYGINFNAPKQIEAFTVDINTGIATIKTRYPNKVTDQLSITTEGASDTNLGTARTFLQNSTNVDVDANTINIGSQQSFVNGEAVLYQTPGVELGGIESNVKYWVRNAGGTRYYIYASLSDALVGGEDGRIDITMPTEGDAATLTPVNSWIGTFGVTEVVNDDTFKVLLDGIPQSGSSSGFSQFTPASWSGSLLRCGIFDDQNGLFFEYDGQQLYACRRSSVEQISGTVTATFNSSLIVGENTKFISQLTAGDKVVIRGQSYKVVHIASENSLSIQPAYRGVTKGNVVVTKTVDTKTPQNQWNLDKADGTGPSGLILNLTKMQMAYIDYSWYGAGKVRFGFKAKNGEVLYFHEYVHNNQFTEAYMRSGNLPARYEVLNLANPTYSPTIAHWGTSVIMDGRFDNDDAYFFTASGSTLSFSNTAEQQTFQGRISQTNAIFNTTIDGVFTPVYFVNAIDSVAVRSIRPGTEISGLYIQAGTKTLFQPQSIGGNRARVYIDKQPTGTSVLDTTYNYGPLADAIPTLFPLVSVRLGPAVDNSLVGAIGQREIINRMQLNLKNVGILTTHDVEIKLILNGNTDNLLFTNIAQPSLSQIIQHGKGDTISGGVELYTFRVSGASSATASIAQATNIDLADIIELGNAIQGGDGIFPDGPDLLTISASVIDTALIGAATPFRVGGRISWTESQA